MGVKCTVDHILQEFYTLFLTRFRTYKIALPPQTKMTSKDDIKGFVSLKFLRPCPYSSHRWDLQITRGSAVLPAIGDNSRQQKKALMSDHGETGPWSLSISIVSRRVKI